MLIDPGGVTGKFFSTGKGPFPSPRRRRCWANNSTDTPSDATSPIEVARKLLLPGLTVPSTGNSFFRDTMAL